MGSPLHEAHARLDAEQASKNADPGADLTSPLGHVPTVAAGVYASPDDYLVPGHAAQRRSGERDDRVIWRLVRDVAADAGVTTHVHALRAAFAVFFLEQKPGEVVALKDLTGHARMDDPRLPAPAEPPPKHGNRA